MRLSLIALVVLSFLTTIQLGCGGGGASSGGGGTISGPDAGVLADVSDNFQFKIKNASSGLTLGIAGEKQTSGAAVEQSNAPSNGVCPTRANTSGPSGPIKCFSTWGGSCTSVDLN
jgi:hypothetical protein